MPTIAIDWVCLYCLCGSRCVLAFCWLWQAAIFSNLRSCRQTFFSQPSSSPGCSRIHPFFFFWPLVCFCFFFFFSPSSPPLFRSSPLHLSGLELLSKYVVALNLRMKTWIACKIRKYQSFRRMKGNVYTEQILLAAMRRASRPLSYFCLLLQFVLRAPLSAGR